jgi:hypothetical protein
VYLYSNKKLLKCGARFERRITKLYARASRTPQVEQENLLLFTGLPLKQAYSEGPALYVVERAIRGNTARCAHGFAPDGVSLNSIR